MVVHGQPEQDREQEQRHPGVDHLGPLEPEEVYADPLLEDQYQQSVGGADREQVP